MEKVTEGCCRWLGCISMARLDATRRLCIVAGYVGSLLIVVLSLVPAMLRPHSGAGGEYEHWIAYALVGVAFGFGFGRIRLQLYSGLALTIGAAILELLQNFVPGRNAEVAGFLASSMGAWFGLGLAFVATVTLRFIAK